MGSSRSVRSETALMTLVMMLTVLISTQCPGVIGFQNLRLGVQTKMGANMIAV